jgi:hypothetical protein
MFHSVQLDEEDAIITVLESSTVSTIGFEELFNSEFYEKIDELKNLNADALICTECRALVPDEWAERFNEFLNSVYETMSNPVVRPVPYTDIPHEIMLEFELSVFGPDSDDPKYMN